MSRLLCMLLAAALNALLLAQLEGYLIALTITLCQISGAAVAGKSCSPLLLLRRDGRLEYARSPAIWGGAQVGLLFGALIASSILSVQFRQQVLTLATGSLFLFLGLARVRCIHAGCCNWTALRTTFDTRIIEIVIASTGFLIAAFITFAPSPHPAAKYLILLTYILFRCTSLLLQRRQFKLSTELPLLLLATATLAVLDVLA